MTSTALDLSLAPLPQVPNEPHTLSSAAGADIKIREVSKNYGAKSVLRDVSLEIKPGEFVAVIGRSGCGKSTLLRLIAGLETPTSGDVSIEGVRLKGLNTKARVMFQDARLMPWMRVRENVGLGLSGNWRSHVLSILADVGLEDRSGDWPAILSGGQRQRVALARALANDPQCLLLDEPLGALDALTRLEMQALLERLWLARGFTALLITHDVEEAVALADRIILIEHGQIALDVPVSFSRPRDRAALAFINLREEVLNQIKGTSPVESISHHKVGEE